MTRIESHEAFAELWRRLMGLFPELEDMDPAERRGAALEADRPVANAIADALGKSGHEYLALEYWRRIGGVNVEEHEAFRLALEILDELQAE